MNLGAILGTISAVLCIGGAIYAKLRWLKGSILARLFAKHAAPIIEQQLKPVKEQLTPNGGASAVDKLTRLDQWRIDFTTSVSEQFTEVKQHLTQQDQQLYEHLRDHAQKNG